MTWKTQINKTVHTNIGLLNGRQKTTLNTANCEVTENRRGSPSLVWGRPAKSVVERPRGFESHTPRLTPFAN
jgi:hypothetical protein